ncbi:MAG: flavodoxin/succinate dehydrogenase/fumarate reductase-like Fe-S protein [Candidatus Thalassarchaeaceae archaeon]|jgi:flavodoxin/succinate dehydrogenase/fumarate reductase-like Fe-S protein
MSDARSLLILYGSQSGNSEEIAINAGKFSSKNNLNPTVRAMDEVTVSDIISQTRILICCSTWGDGEQPDNAEDLWEAANSADITSLNNINFSVLALGDSSYDLFCESGKEWDNWFETKGANRIHPRVDCDVDFEEPAKMWMEQSIQKMSELNVESGVEITITDKEIAKNSDVIDNSVSEKLDAPVSDSIEDFLNNGDRELAVLFGSQSGNSEELASKIVKDATKYGLIGKVYDMDGLDFNTLTNHKRVLIVCSTWGEGEMPDNAEELWKSASDDAAPKLNNTNYSVLSLGDSSYDLFCQSGKDWDIRFDELGANRLVTRVDCDVDYETLAREWTFDALTSMAAVDETGNFHESKLNLIKQFVSGTDTVGASDDDGFAIPSLISKKLQVEVSIFRYDPQTNSTGKDTWLCSLPGNMSVLEVLRSIKSTHDGTLTFRDGVAEDPNTAISINGRLILPGTICLDSIYSPKIGKLNLRIEPLPCFTIIRDLLVDTWALERAREISEPWMISATREGKDTSQGTIGIMSQSEASYLHSIKDFQSSILLHASSDTTPFSESYVGPSNIVSAWARRNDPRISNNKKNEIDKYIGSSKGINSETDLSSIRRQESNKLSISDALLDARTLALSQSSFTGRHGKHVWWYTWSIKSSGKVNDTVLFRQVLGPLGLLSNLFSGVTARMLLGFTRTGGNMINDGLGMVLPPAGIGKMPKQFNSSINNHHEVIAIFNELDGRF